MVPVEAQLPAIYMDALDLACYRIDASVNSDFRKRFQAQDAEKFRRTPDVGIDCKLLMRESPQPRIIDGPSSTGASACSRPSCWQGIHVTHAIHSKNCPDSGNVTAATSVCNVISAAIRRVSPPICRAMM